MDIIERAARALCEYHKDSVEWIGDDTEWKWFVPEVQAVLSALREPDEGMIEAGWFVISCSHPYQSDLEKGIELDCWQAMIDQALKG